MGWAASISDAGGNPGVKDARNNFLPRPHVSLKDWIERRIGGEVSTMEDPDNHRGTLVGFPGRLEAQARVKKEPSARSLEKAAEKGKGSEKGKDKGFEKGLPEKMKEPKDDNVDDAVIEDFIATLPTDELSDEEVPLRQALLDYLEANESIGEPVDGVFLNKAILVPVVREAKKFFP